MEKIMFMPTQGDAPEEYYIIAQTLVSGISYLLVTDEDPETEAEGEAYILRDDSAPEETEALYSFVENDAERESIARVFAQLLDGEEFTIEK